MGPHGRAARPAKKNEGVEPRPIPYVHASYGRPPPPQVRALPQLSWGLVAGSLTAVGPPPQVGALPQLPWGLVAGSLTACTFSRVE